MVKSKGPFIVLDYKICVANTQTNNCNGWKDINVTFKNQVAETIISSENGGKNEVIDLYYRLLASVKFDELQDTYNVTWDSKSWAVFYYILPS